MTAVSQVAENTSSEKLAIIVGVAPDVNLRSLDEVLLALAVQDYQNTEIIVVANDTQARDIEAIIANQPFPSSISCKMLVCDANQILTSAERLNAGLNAASGRYVSILECNDIVYGYSFVKLIDALSASPNSIIVAGTRTAIIDATTGFISSKFSPASPVKHIATLWQDEESIKHFVIDRQKLAGELLTEAELDGLETYFLLLKLSLQNNFDFSLAAESFFERRIDGQQLEIMNTKDSVRQSARTKILDWQARHNLSASSPEVSPEPEVSHPGRKIIERVRARLNRLFQ